MLACVYPAESFGPKAVAVELGRGGQQQRQQHRVAARSSKRRAKLLVAKERSAAAGEAGQRRPRDAQIMLQQDMTEIDDDEILMDYVNQNKEVISLKIVDENYVQENNRNIINVTAEERAFSENDYEESCFSGSNSMEGELISKAPIINLKKGVFEKLSTEILDICEKGCKLTSLQRKALTNKIAEYIVETLKTNTRTKCKEIAGILCNKYKKTFRDSIGSSHEEWGDGIETLTLKIYNAVCYRKSKTAPIKSKRSESIDSDDAEEQERNRDTLLARRQDEYGCVEYSPMLPSTETALTQENKRLQLLKIHDSDCHEDKVLELIEATYPTLRAVINDKSRDLSIIFTDWPYLKHTNYFLHHCCKLLGKNVKKIWLDSLNTKAKTIRQYFKISNHMKKKTDNFINLLTEYKQAAEVTKNNFPKTFVIFRMLIEYFNEKESSLFKLVDLPVGGGGAVLVLSELESMAARQQREIAQQRRLLEQREARLAVLRDAQEPAQQDRLARLRHRLDQQQSKLNRLRLLRSQTDASRANNATLTSDLDCIRALFNEKEKELSLAVAKVEELTRQLEDLRGRHNGPGVASSQGAGGHLGTPASAELEKLRRELLYRNKMNEQQNQVVSQQRLALVQRQAEMASIDARIAQLQGRLQRKRALNQRLSQQLAQQNAASNSDNVIRPGNNFIQQGDSTTSPNNSSINANTGNSPKLDFGSAGLGKPRPAGNIAAIEPYSHIPNDNDFTLNKNDPKYQTLPYNTKFTVNFKAAEDDVNKNKIQHSASASQLGQRATNFQQYGQQIAHSQSQSHIQGQSQPLNANQAQQQMNSPNQQNPQMLNNNLNNNNNINNNNNNNNTANHNFQSENNQSSAQNIRLLAHQHQNAQQKQQQQHVSTNSSSSSLSSSNQSSQNHRNLQTHQKPVSSVAPSFPVKSPIYQTSSTKIHPVMPQTLSLIGRGHPAAPSYASNAGGQNQNSRDLNVGTGVGTLNGQQQHQQQQQQQDAVFPARHGYPPPQQSSTLSTVPTSYQSQHSPSLPQNSANSIFAGYSFGQNQPSPDDRHKIPEKLSDIEQQQQQQQTRFEPNLAGKYEAQQVKYEPHGQPIKLYDQSTGAKHEPTSKLQQHEHNSQGFKHEPQQHFKSEQNQSKFEHLAARFDQQQQQRHDHGAKFEPPSKPPEKPFEYERKPLTGGAEAPKSDAEKTKPALPPKPSKPNPPPRLTQHHDKHEHSPDLGDAKPGINLPSRPEKEEDAIPPIPTSEPPESPTDAQLGGNQQQQQQQLHQVIKARPLSLKKAPLSEQPKLRYAKSNVHVSINRRIEMPPAFLFPETEIPADLMQTEPQQQQQQTIDVTDSNAIKKPHVSPVTCDDIVGSDKLEDVDIVGALNELNIEENKLKSETSEIEGGKPAAEVIRRKKGNLKSTTGKANLSRRVSFDPLALLLDASLEGELELVKKTAKEVANPSSANDEGITALHNAICAGHLEIVKFLVEFGCDVNAQDSDGWTPLHCAASCNNLAMVRFLVEHGACIFATTLSDHETAAEKCEEDEEGFDGCSEYLYSVQEKLGIMNNGQVFAVFDYDAQHSDELTLKNGDSLVILRKGDDNEREWWWSKLGNREGYVPRNLLGLYPRVQPAKTD